MDFYPVFISIVVVTHNLSKEIEGIIQNYTSVLTSLVNDYELIIVDNGSQDDSVSLLKKLTSIDGLPNLQVYALTKRVDVNTASWVGLENALGDFVAVIDPLADDIGFVSKMLGKAVCGADVVFANNAKKPIQTLAYRIAFKLFNIIYKLFNDIDLDKEAPQYRILSKRVVNFILQHPQPAVTYRHLPVTGGFSRANLDYSAIPKVSRTKCLSESIDRGMRLLVSTTRVPMRLVTSLSFLGAVINLVYSIYIVSIALIKQNVAPGWISLSLQQSGMFFLISLVLLILGEYILHTASLSNKSPLYNIAQEFCSARLLKRERLNIEELTRSTALVSDIPSEVI